MLQADKQVLLAGVKRSALELRQKEVRAAALPPPSRTALSESGSASAIPRWTLTGRAPLDQAC